MSEWPYKEIVAFREKEKSKRFLFKPDDDRLFIEQDGEVKPYGFIRYFVPPYILPENQLATYAARVVTRFAKKWIEDNGNAVNA
jgi:hypothetical protein